MSRWYTYSEYVDLETGEILNKSRFKRENYQIVSKNYKVEEKNGYLIKTITNECKINKQTKIEFPE